MCCHVYLEFVAVGKNNLNFVSAKANENKITTNFDVNMAGNGDGAGAGAGAGAVAVGLP